MNIEIHRPELEALIQQRMASGRFGSVEDVLMDALKTAAFAEGPSTPRPRRKNFTQFLMDSPLWGSGLELERNKDFPRPVDL